MIVRLEKTGHYCATTHVEEPRVLRRETAHVRLGTDGEDAIAAERHGVGSGHGL